VFSAGDCKKNLPEGEEQHQLLNDILSRGTKREKFSMGNEYFSEEKGIFSQKEIARSVRRPPLVM